MHFLQIRREPDQNLLSADTDHHLHQIRYGKSKGFFKNSEFYFSRESYSFYIFGRKVTVYSYIIPIFGYTAMMGKFPYLKRS